MKFQFHAFLTAIQFLTRVPVPGGMNTASPNLALLPASVVYFPIVGGCVGLITGLVVFAAAEYWPMPIAVLLALVVEALLTGAFHEDAVADCADAFGGGWSRDDVLRIMKDSRVGSYGTLGLGLAVALRVFGLIEVKADELLLVTTAAGALGRWVILPLMAWIPQVPNRDGLSKDIGTQVSKRTVVVGTLLACPFAAWYAWTMPWACVWGLLVSVVIIFWWGHYVKRRLGGITGDCLGAACYIVQIVFTLSASLVVLRI